MRKALYGLTLLGMIVQFVFTGCGGGGGGSVIPPIGSEPSYTVGVVVTGLTGTGLVLQNEWEDDLSISSNGTFTFSKAIQNGSSYGVTVKTHPTGPNQACSVQYGYGSISGADITDVKVACFAVQKLVAFDGVTRDYYGKSVSVSGDGSMALVGVPRDDVGANEDQGSAYLYSLNGSVWNLVVKLTPSDGEPFGWFGSSVFISPDGSTLVIGSYADDIGPYPTHGSIYVYKWNGASWVDTKLTFDELGSQGYGMGFSVAGSANGNIIAAGAPGAKASGPESIGAVYVYKWNGSGWEETKLIASDHAANDSFGSSVAVSSDGGTVVVGAYADDFDGKVDQGSIYIYKWNGSVWEETKLFASDGAANDYFGMSTSVSSDGSKVFAGAPGDGNISGNGGQGSVYVYTLSGASWAEKKLTASDGEYNDSFGFSVSVSADGSTLLVGADLATYPEAAQGAAYLYTWDGSAWNETKIGAYDGNLTDHFGCSAAMSADGTTMVVGAEYGDVGPIAEQGAVYIFR